MISEKLIFEILGIVMLKITYLIILVTLLVVTTISYQHASAQQQQQQSYYVYVEPLPDYATRYASNAIYDATNAWSNANPNIKFYKVDTPQQANLDVQWVRDYGTYNGRAGEYTGNGIIQIGLGDSNCLNRWEPYSAETVTHIAKHEIGHFLGLQHSTDPSNIMYPYTPIQYGLVEIQNNLAANYAWFVPACTENAVTSFQYSVKTSDPTYGFDLYFVPSKDEFDKWSKGGTFQYYSSDGCSAKGYLSFGGTCNGVAKGSGLLIIINNQQTNPLSTITVDMAEQSGTVVQPQSSGLSPQEPTAQPQPSSSGTVTGSVKTDQDQYVISTGQMTEVTISGQVGNPQGGKVILTITKPDGTSEVVQAYITGRGDFSTPIILDNYSPLGQYQVQANYENSDFSSTSFNVATEGSQTGATPSPSSNQPPTTQSVTPVPTTPPSSSTEPTSNPIPGKITVDGTNIEVPYTISGGFLTQIRTSPNSNSIFISVEPTDNGVLTLELPRKLIDSQNNGQDLGFIITGSGGGGVSSKELSSSNAESRIITVNFSPGLDLIHITGTQVAVPEFGSMVGVVSILSIISVIIISKKIRYHLS